MQRIRDRLSHASEVRRHAALPMREPRVPMAAPGRSPAGVPGNAWHLLALDDVATSPSVSVVVPAKDCQPTLDRLLASLSRTDAPVGASRPELEIIVVDDASSPPLVVPDGVTLVRLEPSPSFGAGRARNEGARRATGDILLFLDADMLVGRAAVSRLARWCSAHPAAVVTGVIAFFDVDEVGAEQLDAAIESGRLQSTLADFERNDQDWRDPHFLRTADMTLEDPEIFSVTIGAVMCLPRALHEAIGGLRELGRRGIEDTEYGYRLHTAGALMVLDRTAELWHQGRRFFSSEHAAQAKQDRADLNNELMASARYRVDSSTARRVPVAVVHAVGDASVDGFADSDRRDLVTAEDRDGADVLDPVDAVGVPYRIDVHRSCRVAPGSFGALIDRVRRDGLGSLSVESPEGDLLMTVTSRRAEGRASLIGLRGDAASAHVGSAFGARTAPAADFDIS
ncbi:MAG: glycosyltransferase family 2 protein [Acidimicrobiales bacterium]